MSNILIINAHHYYPFAEGKLNGTLVQMADELLTADGHQTRIVEVDKGWDVDQVHIPAHRDRPFRLNVTACSG